MTTAPVPAASPRPFERRWNRSLHRYPSNSSRYVSLAIVVATTIVLYYQLYLAGGVATNILRGLHMSFTDYVNVNVIGYLLGATASVVAGLADRYGRANIVTAGLALVGLLCLFALPNVHSKLAFESFTETVERRNPALTATGLAVWGLMIRVVIAISIFFVPKVVTTATTLVEQGPVVQAVLANPTPVGRTTVGKVATAVAANPATVAQLQAVAGRDAALLAALKTHPTVAAAFAKAQAAGAKPSPTQLAQIKTALGAPAFAELIKPQTAKDLALLSTTGPQKLGAANFAALTNPNPALGTALKTLSTHGPAVQKAATDSPKQWRTYFFVGVGGEVVFIPLILLMAGFWDPRKAKRAEEEHDVWLAAEMAKLEH